MKVVLFEPEDVSDLYPLVYLRPVFELRCGIYTLREKIVRKFPDSEIFLETRDELDAVTAAKHERDRVNSFEAVRPDDDILLVSAGAILHQDPEFYTQEERVGVDQEDNFVWAFLSQDTVERLDSPASIGLAQKAREELASFTVDDCLIQYPWDLIDITGDEIELDYRDFYTRVRESNPLQGAKMMGSAEDLSIGKDVEIQPFSWIDCREGPVVIEDGVTVRAHTSIEGPAYIGADTQLCEAKIREGTSIGPVCRVGGEVEESILHGYANKYHTGF
ncbi:MAG: putative sugar nucleotidyl transferase, partial [Planctomycetota bacterium]